MLTGLVGKSPNRAGNEWAGTRLGNDLKDRAAAASRGTAGACRAVESPRRVQYKAVVRLHGRITLEQVQSGEGPPSAGVTDHFEDGAMPQAANPGRAVEVADRVED